MKKLLVILGPTAIGKTDLAIYLAKKFKGELISCDSRQVYKNLDIGTGKLPLKFDSLIKQERKWIINGIPIHLYDVVNPREQYNVARFVKDAESAIGEIIKRKKLSILVGGTGLYIRALTHGLANIFIPPNKRLRRQLENLNLDQLQTKIKTLSKERWEKMNYSDQQNPRRLVRAIELASAKVNMTRKEQYDVLKIGLTAPREILYKRSDDRVITRIDQGMIDEAEKLHKKGLSLNRMKQLGLEYGILADYLTGKINKEQLIKIMQGEIHGFIRRQLTWFKKEKDIIWFDITAKEYLIKVEKQISEWYY